MPKTETNVVVVGSGPYALSVAAHLRARGVEHRIFGPPMKFWSDMPVGINLKSFAFATNIYAPERGYGFEEWCRARGLEDYEPCTMHNFAAYGVWAQERLVPDLDTSTVTRVSVVGDRRFEVATSSGETVRARSVVFSTGLGDLDETPEVIAKLGPELCTHTSTHTSYAHFRGKDVAVVGAGASAVEAAALIHHEGGHPVMLVREREILFNSRAPRYRPLKERIVQPQSVLGQGRMSYALEKLPFGFYFVREEKRVKAATTLFGPVAPWWIRDRFDGKVEPLLRTSVIASERVGSRARLTVQEEGKDARTIDVDHVVAGTGFVYDVDRLKYLDEDFKARVRRLRRAPALSINFESSVKGAYFAGPIATYNFGPLLRFVSGAKFTAPAVARHIAGPVREVRSALRRFGGVQVSAGAAG